MKFGPLPLLETKGGILAHSMRLENGKRLRKGLVIDDETIALLDDAGVQSITVAMPEPGDVLEDDAATRIAKAMDVSGLRSEPASTGRVNIFAEFNGVFRVSVAKVDALNAVDPGITFATLPDFAAVNEGRLVATIKIIPYAVSGSALADVLSHDLAGTISLAAFEKKRVGVISTTLPALKESILVKTLANLEARLSLSASEIVEELRVPHDEQAICGAIEALAPKSDLLVLFGASAISDDEDVIPSAIRKAGGDVTSFGMPVDPGNLLLLAKLGDKPVLGAPGCARSPAENGFDWVLQRMLADFDVERKDIVGLGVGGLLMETGSRPHSRIKAAETSEDRIAAIVLAAGQSRRMGDENKMTVDFNGKPMVRHVVEAAQQSRVAETLLITGYEPDAVMDAVNGLNVTQVHNANFKEGLSTSLVTGISGLSKKTARAIVLLGDMPFVDSSMINRLIEASDQNPECIIVSTHGGKRGNPVLWPSAFFDEVMQAKGDVGARHVIGQNADMVVEVELGQAASIDLDTPETLKAFQSDD